MELKKNPKYDVHLMTGMLRNLGLTISLGIVIAIFEMPSSGNTGIIDLVGPAADFEEIIEIPPTTQLPPPPPNMQIRKIVEVPDLIEIEEELKIELDVEVTELTVVEAINFTMAEPEEEEVEETFLIVEDFPKYPGGIKAFYEFVGQKIKYPSYALNMGIEGKVYLQFVVDKQGKLGEILVVKGVGAGLDEEAIRVLKLVPNFEPGKQRGKPVKVRMTVPIHFKLATY